MAKLSETGVDLATIPGLDSLFNEVPQPFMDLETRYKQETEKS